MQPIDDRMQFRAINYNWKNPQANELHFYLTSNAIFCSIIVIE